MCATYGKLLINTALGFDTYLVMRHGQTQVASSESTVESASPVSTAPESRLGCYFCNDIVAATNSQKDRTLDQQCTVTRPGLSFIASALAVELMVALSHPKVSRDDEDEEAVSDTSPVDRNAPPEIPHQIRGSVAGFTQFTPHVRIGSILVIFMVDSNLLIVQLSRPPHSAAAQRVLLPSCRLFGSVASASFTRRARTRRSWKPPAASPASWRT